MLFRVLFISFFTFFVSIASYAQETSKRLSAEALKEDLSLLRYHLETVQPRLYQYFPKDSFDLAFEKIEAYISDPRTSFEFYRSLRLLNRYIANGHNNIYPAQSDIDDMAKNKLRFPFDLYYYDNKLYVKHNLSDNVEVKEGDYIIKINGERVEDLLSEIIYDMSTDGFNKSLPMRQATSRFHSQYYLKYGEFKEFTLELSDESGSRYETTVNGELLTQMQTRRKEKYNMPQPSWFQTDTKAYTLDYVDDVAVMTLRTFAKGWVKSSLGYSYKKFFKEAFQEIADKGSKKMILDLRGNGGGDPMPTLYLFSYLYEEDFKFYEDITTKVKRIPQPKYYMGSQFWFNAFSWTMVKKKGDGYQARILRKTSKRAKVDNIFSGDLYVLIDPASYSATGEMVGILKNYDRAVFIGEETGGNPVTNTSGVMETIELPNSGIRSTLSFVCFDMAVDFENDGTGLLPDYHIKNSLRDEQEGRDAAMEFAVKMAQK